MIRRLPHWRDAVGARWTGLAPVAKAWTVFFASAGAVSALATRGAAHAALWVLGLGAWVVLWALVRPSPARLVAVFALVAATALPVLALAQDQTLAHGASEWLVIGLPALWRASVPRLIRWGVTGVGVTAVVAFRQVELLIILTVCAGAGLVLLPDRDANVGRRALLGALAAATLLPLAAGILAASLPDGTLPFGSTALGLTASMQGNWLGHGDPGGLRGLLGLALSDGAVVAMLLLGLGLASVYGAFSAALAGPAGTSDACRVLAGVQLSSFLALALLGTSLTTGEPALLIFLAAAVWRPAS